MKILLLGLGRFGRKIAERLLNYGHELLIVENDPFVVFEFSKNVKGNYKVCVGDATSLLIWEYLPLKEIDLIISSLRSGEFNKTICSIIREIFKLYELPVIVLSSNNSYEKVFSNFNCKTIYLPELIASFIEGLTLKNIVKPVGIGLGKNEILEVIVSAKSPYTRVPINIRRLRHWNIALIYRKDKILLPKGRILLKPGDRVILTGDDPRVVLEVAKAMAFGEPQFPLSFGENLLTVLKKRDLHYLKEFYYIWKHTRVKNIVLFTSDEVQNELPKVVSDRSFLNSLQVEKGTNYNIIFDRNLHSHHSAGLVSIPYKKRFLFFRNVNLKRFFNQEIPFLIPRLSFPYRKVLVSLNNQYPAGIIEQVFEIYQLFQVEKLTFIYVGFPNVLASSKDKRNLEKALLLIEEYAKLYNAKEKIEILQMEGNPKKKTLERLKDYDLLVVGFEKKKIGFFEPYAPYLLVKESRKSVLGIPAERAEVES